MSGPRQHEAELVMRPRGGALVFAVVYCGVIGAVAIAFLWAGLVADDGGRRGHPLFVVLGLILLLPSVLMLTLVVRLRGKVTDDAVIIRGLGGRVRNIPLADLAAIGMVFTSQPKITGWVPYLWLRSGAVVRLPIGLFAGKMPPRRQAEPGPLPDWSDIAASKQGQYCLEIYRRATLLQRPGGPLSLDRESTRSGGRSRERAYWCADPNIGSHLLPKT